MATAFSHLSRSCAALILVLGVACKRGQPKPAERPVAVPAVEPVKVVEDPWQAGRLPASELAGEPQRGGELVVGVDVEPATLNPIVSNDWVGKKVVNRRVYESLVRVDAADDPRYAIVPQLAERWEISADGKVYTFHLRQDVHWHDGKPFSARDVIATLDKLRDPRTLAASMRADFAELEKYSAPDASTVVMSWKHPFFSVLDAVAELGIQPAHVIQKLTAADYNQSAKNPLNRAPLGTGPFKFSQWESTSKIVLERNPDYWGRQAYLDRLVFRIVPDATVRLQLAERGELQLLYHVKTEQWTDMRSQQLRERWNRSRFYGSKYAWIGWNVKRLFFGDARVRRAMTLLVDRPGIIDKLMHGLPRATNCHFYWASAACDPTLEPLPYDPAAAAALLDEADVRDHDGDGLRDHNGTPFRFSLSLPSSSAESGKQAAMIKEDMGRAGIDVQIDRVEWSAFVKRMGEHDFDATMLQWGGDARMDPTSIWHSSGIDGGSNFISYSNPEVDRLIEQARVTLDDNGRNALFRQFGAILQAEQPYTFLYVPAELDLLDARVHGAKPSLYGWQFEDIWLAAAPGGQ